MFYLEFVGKALPGNSFSANGISRNEQVLYWTRVGTEFPRDWLHQRLAVARANLRKSIPDGLLVRVSMVGNETETSQKTMHDFVSSLYAGIPGELRKILFANL